MNRAHPQTPFRCRLSSHCCCCSCHCCPRIMALLDVPCTSFAVPVRLMRLSCQSPVPNFALQAAHLQATANRCQHCHLPSRHPTPTLLMLVAQEPPFSLRAMSLARRLRHSWFLGKLCKTFPSVACARQWSSPRLVLATSPIVLCVCVLCVLLFLSPIHFSCGTISAIGPIKIFQDRMIMWLKVLTKSEHYFLHCSSPQLRSPPPSAEKPCAFGLRLLRLLFTFL